MSKPAIDHETTTSTADMAAIVSLTPRRLQQLAAEGWLEGRVGRDQWNVLRTVRTYLSHCAHIGRKAA